MTFQGSRKTFRLPVHKVLESGSLNILISPSVYLTGSNRKLLLYNFNCSVYAGCLYHAVRAGIIMPLLCMRPRQRCHPSQVKASFQCQGLFGLTRFMECSITWVLSKHLQRFLLCDYLLPCSGNPINRPLTLSASLHPFGRQSHTLLAQGLPGARPKSGFARLMDKLTLLPPPGQTRTRPSGSCWKFSPNLLQITHPAHPLTSRSRSKNYWSDYLTFTACQIFWTLTLTPVSRSYTFLQRILRAPVLCLHSLTIKRPRWQSDCVSILFP